jgi:hypothetical protein
MIKGFTFFAALLIFGFDSVPASANADLEINISATVDVFCHIYPPADDEVSVQSGQATIGQVREICNTPNGYDVTTSFTNLSTGELDVGGSAYSIANGLSTRTSLVPAAQTLTWQLADVQLAQADLPVLMRVVITPR